MIRTLSNSSPQAKDFLKFLRSDLKTHRVRLKFSRSRTVKYDKQNTAAAYFEEPSSNRWGVIRIGTGNRKPINILTNLIHEYCHFLQWKHKEPIWKNFQGSNDDEQYLVLEKQTENDAMKLIREWDLPVNHSAIRKRSRSYIAFLRQESK